MGPTKKKRRSSQDSSDDDHDRRKRHHSSSENDSDSEEASSSSDAKRRRSKHKKHRSKHSKSHKSKDDRSSSRERIMADKELKRKSEIKREKEIMKATETTGEKRARRLAKKAMKEQRRKEKMGWDQEYMGFTNQDNPFGDENLLIPFVWKKKNENENIDDDEQHRQRGKKMMDNRIELEKVKKRRLERERELTERENLKEMEQRDKEAEYHRVWEKQEDNFHLNQAKLRSQIRIKDARAKPIDLLAKYISAEDDELAIEMHEPYTYLNGMTMMDLEDLLEDITVYLELEKGKNADYWRDIIIVTEDELNKLRKLEPTSKEYVGDRRDGINSAVTDEVSAVFRGKSTNQLKSLEQQITSRLSGGEGIDVGYWESLLRQLKSHMAKSRLRERHQEVLKMKLFKLKQEQGIQPTGPLFPITSKEGGQSSPQPSTSSSVKLSTDAATASAASISGEATGEDVTDQAPDDLDISLEEEDFDAPFVAVYEAGSYSPLLISADDLDIDAVIYDVEDDMKKLEFARQQVLSTGKVRLDNEGDFVKKAKEGMNDEEAQFSVEVPVTAQAFLWSDKYRPRKPRFFNRVHTGFEWNKYNQTHYDVDNPPPKIVQGYKFNLFYPDLIDRTKPPEYTLTPVENEPDFSILRFKAGPPYEDIAFKVVNREWETGWKRGFRCQFQNNIFQLWFHFKRYRYRR